MGLLARRRALGASLVALTLATLFACDGSSTGAPCDPPVLFGHRGTPLRAPENTQPAFDWAIAEGADGIELDVKRTADDVLVAMHDRTTERTTDDPEPRRIDALTVDEISALDAGAWFSSSFAGTRVPTLIEAAEAIDERVLILVDHVAPDTVSLVARASEEPALVGRMWASSFDLDTLAELHAAAPGVPIVAYVDSLDEIDRAIEVGAFALRIPKDIESDLSLQDMVRSRGLVPAVSGRYTQWNGGIGLVNDMARTAERRRERAPEGCLD